MRHLPSILLLMLTWPWIACQEADDPSVEGGYLFVLADLPDGPEHFVAVTFDPETIAQLEAQLALPEDQRKLFPNGPIDRGNGDHNLDWNWHYVPNQWELAEVTIELCDGRPQYVHDNLDYYLDKVGHYCPWGAYVVEKLSD